LYFSEGRIAIERPAVQAVDVVLDTILGFDDAVMLYEFRGRQFVILCGDACLPLYGFRICLSGGLLERGQLSSGLPNRIAMGSVDTLLKIGSAGFGFRRIRDVLGHGQAFPFVAMWSRR